MATAPMPVLFRVLILAAILTAGCGAGYVNPDITDPAQAKRQLASDKSLCRQLANDTVAPTFGMERFESDPTIEAQATRYEANVIEDDANESVYTRCMRDRGWRSR